MIGTINLSDCPFDEIDGSIISRRDLGLRTQSVEVYEVLDLTVVIIVSHLVRRSIKEDVNHPTNCCISNQPHLSGGPGKMARL